MQQEKYDNQRKTTLEKYGIYLLRFWDNEIFQNSNGVLEVIIYKLQGT